ncbi:MAG: hypothetical protein OXC27_14675 [Caldilineaceae bacterium]|nr:hypothetical protein [Caldilineaceae bacterium]
MHEIGLIALFGSGETAPGAYRIHERVMRELPAPVKVAILETPAGFELNSPAVAGKVGAYLERHLRNYSPRVSIVPARKRGTAFDPDDPDLAEPIFGSSYLFMGPGSPSYTVRQLRDSYAWNALRARNRLGGAICFSSATTVASGRYTLPVYEIYKVGQDLHWIEGLAFFADFGLRLSVIPHWNNNDGGDELDTSHCYMGQPRFDELLAMLPRGVTVLGIDENTGVVIEPMTGECELVGQGGASVLTSEGEQVFESGARFPASALGDWRLPPTPQDGIPGEIWQRACAARDAAEQPVDEPTPQPVLELAERRQAARAERDWTQADALRDEIAALGWQVHDTPDGSRLEKASAQ